MFPFGRIFGHLASMRDNLIVTNGDCNNGLYNFFISLAWLPKWVSTEVSFLDSLSCLLTLFSSMKLVLSDTHLKNLIPRNLSDNTFI